MGVQFSSSYTQRVYYYTNWLSVWAARGGIAQSDNSDGVYQKVWFYDGPEIHYCIMWLSGNPVTDPNYTQEQNDADLASFNSNVAPLCNLVIERKASDGRTVIRQTTANKAKNFNLKVFSLAPGDPGSLFAKRPNSTNNALLDAGDVTVTCYTVGNTVTTDPTQAVLTTVDWEPPYDYELIGGFIDFPTSILESVPEVWTVSAVGVPDIPAPYGGSVPFVYPVDLSLVTSTRVVSDGRASQYLQYSAVYHTNKLRWIFTHPTSNAMRVQLYVETFK